MYLAVSKLKVVSVKEAEFERVWKTHKIDTDGIRGFKKFNLFKGNINKEFSLYIFWSYSPILPVFWSKSSIKLKIFLILLLRVGILKLIPTLLIKEATIYNLSN